MFRKSNVWIMFAVFGMSSAIDGMFNYHDFRLGIPLFICSLLVFISSEDYENMEREQPSERMKALGRLLKDHK